MELLKRNTDYALRALVHLAGLGCGELASATSISRETDTPEPLLRKLLQKLARPGLIASERGLRGGFRIVKRPEAVSLLQVVEVIQGNVAVNRCFLGRKSCPHRSHCRLSAKLRGVQEQLIDLLRGISVADLVVERRRPRKKTEATASVIGKTSSRGQRVERAADRTV